MAATTQANITSNVLNKSTERNPAKTITPPVRIPYTHIHAKRIRTKDVCSFWLLCCFFCFQIQNAYDWEMNMGEWNVPSTHTHSHTERHVHWNQRIFSLLIKWYNLKEAIHGVHVHRTQTDRHTHFLHTQNEKNQQTNSVLCTAMQKMGIRVRKKH